MVTRDATRETQFCAMSLTRRRFLTLASGLLASGALAPALAACGDDDVDDGDTDNATDDEVAAADDADSDVELPDGFPGDLPLPGQLRVQTDQSGETEDGREIVIIVFGEGDLEDFIDEMGDAIHANYEVEDEFIEEDGESARWNFRDDQWVRARVNVEEYMPNPSLISVTFDMQDH